MKQNKKSTKSPKKSKSKVVVGSSTTTNDNEENTNNNNNNADHPSGEIFTPQFIVDQRQKELEKERRDDVNSGTDNSKKKAKKKKAPPSPKKKAAKKKKASSSVIVNSNYSEAKEEHPSGEIITPQFIDDMRQKETERVIRSLVVEDHHPANNIADEMEQNEKAAATMRVSTSSTSQQNSSNKNNKKDSASSKTTSSRRLLKKENSSKKKLPPPPPSPPLEDSPSDSTAARLVERTPSIASPVPLSRSEPVHRSSAALSVPGAYAHAGPDSPIPGSTERRTRLAASSLLVASTTANATAPQEHQNWDDTAASVTSATDVDATSDEPNDDMFAPMGPAPTSAGPTTTSHVDHDIEQQQQQQSQTTRGDNSRNSRFSTRFSMRGGGGDNNNSSSALVKAQLVDDAEPVFFAEDAAVDNFRRKLIAGLVVAAVICVIVITLTMALRDKDDVNAELVCEFEDLMCCGVDFEKEPFPRVIALTCHCFNTTESIYEDLTPHEQEALYPAMLERLPTPNSFFDAELDQLDDIDPFSCHPYNQAALAMSQPERLGLSPQQAMETPLSAFFDMLSLYVIYESMFGLNWTKKEGWFESEQSDLCVFSGIDCIFVDTISRLWLPNNQLQGSIPTEIGLLTSMREFDFSGNKDIVGPIPTQLASLTSLGTLDLSESPMGGSIPTFLGNMTSLNRLDLASCDLTGTIPTELFQLQAGSLKFLSLSDNQLKGTVSTEFAKFTDLDILRLNNNEMTGTLPLELMQMENLGLLHVGDNQFNGTIPEFLGNMPKLRLLDVFNSGLTGSIPESFCGNNDGTTGSGSGGVEQQLGTRQLVVDCRTMEPCSCCSRDGSLGVRLICGEERPVAAIGNA